MNRCRFLLQPASFVNPSFAGPARALKGDAVYEEIPALVNDQPPSCLYGGGSSNHDGTGSGSIARTDPVYAVQSLLTSTSYPTVYGNTINDYPNYPIYQYVTTAPAPLLQAFKTPIAAGSANLPCDVHLVNFRLF